MTKTKTLMAINVTLTTGNATLGEPTINITQKGINQVSVTGSVRVSDLTGCPATVRVTVDADDCSGNSAEQCAASADITDNIAPTITCQASGGTVNESCTGTVRFEATVTDNCCVNAEAVSAGVELASGSATLGSPEVTKTQVGPNLVRVTGSVTVSDVSGCSATIRVQVDARDCCGNQADQCADTAEVSDDAAPTITCQASGGSAGEGCEGTVTFEATVSDNCCVHTEGVTVDVSLISGSATLGQPSVTKTQNGPNQVLVSGSVSVSEVSACPARVRVTVNASDCCGTAAEQCEVTADISDDTSPTITSEATGGEVNENCQGRVTFEATVSDNCCVRSEDVQVNVRLTTGNATLGEPQITKTQSGPDQVLVSGSVSVSGLEGCPATVEVSVDASDCCENAAERRVASANVVDQAPPTITCDATGGTVSEGCAATVRFEATVRDNCCVEAEALRVNVALVSGSATLGEPDVTVTQNGANQVLVSGSVSVSDVEGCPARVRVTVDAADCCENAAEQCAATADVTDATAPTIACTATGGRVGESCQGTVTFQATVTDNCCVRTEDVSVNVSLTTGNATLGEPTINITQNGANQVRISGSVAVSDLESCPATVRVTVNASDCCENAAQQRVVTADVIDDTAPTITCGAAGGSLNEGCGGAVTFEATVTDNCCVEAEAVTVDVGLISGSATLGQPDITKTQVGPNRVRVTGSIEVSDVQSCSATVRVAVEAVDCCDNQAQRCVATADLSDDTAPTITCEATGSTVDQTCSGTVNFEASVADNCCVETGDVRVTVSLVSGTATLGTPTISLTQNGRDQVRVSGSVLISGLVGAAATVRVTVEADDCCGNGAGPCVAEGSVSHTGDRDGDGIGDICDNCTDAPNRGQADADQDGVGNACDNCPQIFNPDQADADADGFGDACDNCPRGPDDADRDRDGDADACDNCPDASNADQADRDSDRFGDVCDNCPSTANQGQDDLDADGLGDVCDNCPLVANPDQTDSDRDDVGDACDNCDNQPNGGQADADADGVGDACDNCRAAANGDQNDRDQDGVGDACDNCPEHFNPDQQDSDGNGIGDPCEAPRPDVPPVTLNQVEVITCNIPHEFVFNCRDLHGDVLTAVLLEEPSQGSLTVEGTSGSYVPPPDFNGVQFVDYYCTDGRFDGETSTLALWVLTCEEEQLTDTGTGAGRPSPRCGGFGAHALLLTLGGLGFLRLLAPRRIRG